MEMSGSVAAGGGQGSRGGVPEPFLIPHLFIWPYGGTAVFLSGSFTGWSTIIPMSRIEGQPNAFQATCSLPPGFHQYKFIVDGVWRHDEQKQFINASFGVVNTIFVEQPYILPSINNAGTPSGSHMELGHFVPGHMEAFPRTSESALHLSRYHLSKFMSSNTVFDLIPMSGKVIVLDIDLSIQQAFHALYEQEVSVAPVWDSSKCKFVGVLSAMDIIQILKQLESHGSTSTMPEEQPKTHTIAAWRERELHQCGTGNSRRTYPWRFVDAVPDESLKDIALKFLQNKVPAVPVIDSSSEGGSVPQLLHIASLTDILKCICRHIKNCSGFLPILQLPVGSIPLGTWVPKVGESDKQPPAMLKPAASVSDAISILIQGEVSSIPIVNVDNSLLYIYSKSDITALAKNEVYAWISLDKYCIYQQMFRDHRLPCAMIDQQLLPVCVRTDTLHSVMERLANSDVEELVVVEAGSRRVEGVISIGDVFRFLFGY
ncbi:sucrose nonfermenting 4-like protein isoform X1 [Vicia villosa]|uniref:sucrose nonfermenting 4-like protein isoform X1 n=2 Tax=Vicia villosa TaxID=3911 RepID=UPI00273B3523|nr:sucrose nonfermenting 4-like protein isoform X1 [Vicia villosa]